VAEDQDIVIDLKAGRGDNGFSATLDIVPAGLTAPMKADTKLALKPMTKAEPSKDEKAVAAIGSRPAAITSTPENRKDPLNTDPYPAELEKPKPAAKAKPTFGIKKAEAKAEPEPVADEPEEAEPEPDVTNETVNTMSGGAGGASEPGPEEEAPAPKPRGIFAKVGNG